MLNVALYEPEIPPNTGNIIRLCANTGTGLHLIHPLGFSPTDKQVKRAGLDYHEWARVHHHKDYLAFQEAMQQKRVFAFSTHGKALYTEIQYQQDDVFLFGPETRGLPAGVMAALPPEQILRIPMLPNSRSLNLSNTVAIAVYEALRQLQFVTLT
jgi:tRNA (cytidine/uridine-2'-O-)-methyltransferase